MKCLSEASRDVVLFHYQHRVAGSRQRRRTCQATDAGTDHDCVRASIRRHVTVLIGESVTLSETATPDTPRLLPIPKAQAHESSIMTTPACDEAVHVVGSSQ